MAACRIVSPVVPRPAAMPARKGTLCIRVSAEPGSGSAGTTTSEEPKWKQKLAAADKHAEETRRATAKNQEEYKQRQRQMQAGGGADQAAGVGLNELEFQPVITAEGAILDCSKEGAKATIYAIYNADKVLQYIGISRQVYQSLRLHFARMPSQCAWIQVLHIARPSRSVLEAIRERWEKENGSIPPGNDGGEVQNRWENALDVKPMMTDAEKQAVYTAAPGPPKAKAMKEVARRVERELEAAFKAAGCTEPLRFDPKLKETGMLDLKSTAYQPEKSVPSK